ncbi:MAG: hypothetical protein D6806_00120 [Deltaproteobacteria bacterium]|nr:MAG: hypothetical protein D6806_00120 [Deltaproteobacteria bacterium]
MRSGKTRKLALVMVALSSAWLASACGTGEAEAVDSCTECRNVEVCVEEGGQLYCADPCLRHIDCALGFWCVPEQDEVNPGNVEWVCMPEEYYTGRGRVWNWGSSNCVEGGSDPCPTGMTCLVDDSANPDIYFCADSCSTDAECLSGCCYMWAYPQGYCAPYYPYCQSGIGEVYYWGHENCNNAGNECPSGMSCVMNDTANPIDYYCSDSCTVGSDCVTGCCSGGFCAPEHPFCM